MITIKLNLDKNIREKFKKYNINKAKLENFLNFITNDIKNTRKWWHFDINVIGIKGVDSQYFWDEDEIEVALKCNNCKTDKQRRIYFLSSLVHEYRHFVQCKIEKVSEKKLDYNEDDIEKGSDKYTKNKYELECVEWENLVEKFNDFI
tara:strand:- start:357 stop:800 length:444 start_codon:yes stop_codon:yes gene_type:complete